jgi:hypothetical protein
VREAGKEPEEPEMKSFAEIKWVTGESMVLQETRLFAKIMMEIRRGGSKVSVVHTALVQHRCL